MGTALHSRCATVSPFVSVVLCPFTGIARVWLNLSILPGPDGQAVVVPTIASTMNSIEMRNMRMPMSHWCSMQKKCTSPACVVVSAMVLFLRILVKDSLRGSLISFDDTFE